MEISNLIKKQEEERMRLHIKCLAKAECAEDCDASTVVRLGFVVSISEKEVLEEIRKLKKNEEIEERDRNTELIRTVNGIWGAFNLNEKLYILERSGYKLEK